MRFAPRALLAAALALAACGNGTRAPRFAIEVASTRVVVDESFGSDSRLPLSSLTPEGRGGESLAGW